MTTMKEKREAIVSALGELIKMMNDPNFDLTDYSMALQIVDILRDAETFVRGPANCEWKNSVFAMRKMAKDWIAGDHIDSIRWILTQNTIWLSYALDNPARVPQPRRELDPNSETYRCM